MVVIAAGVGLVAADWPTAGMSSADSADIFSPGTPTPGGLSPDRLSADGLTSELESQAGQGVVLGAAENQAESASTMPTHPMPTHLMPTYLGPTHPNSISPDSVRPAGPFQNLNVAVNNLNVAVDTATTPIASAQAPLFRQASLLSSFSPSDRALISAISQQAFIDATLDVSEAFFGVIRGAQPNLNTLQLAGGDTSTVTNTITNTGADAAGDAKADASVDTPTNVLPGIPADAPGGITTDTAADPSGDIAADNVAISGGARPIEGATGRLSLLVRFPNRLDLEITDAWESQHEWLLTAALAQAGICSSSGVTDGAHSVTGTAGNTGTNSTVGCDELVAQLVPSMEPPERGEYERVAQERTAGTSVPTRTYLAAAFELALWRPVGMHPAAADIYRQIAASTRLQTASDDFGCDISALWIAAAVESELPLVGAINFGVISLTGELSDNAHEDRAYDIPSLARFAARRGCEAADAAMRGNGATGGATNPVATLKLATDAPFWHRPDTDNLSDRISLTINPTLARWRLYDAELIGSFRSCDIAERILPSPETVFAGRFQVHPCLSEALAALVAAARANGIYLNGWGWRSTQQQVTLRISNCSLPSRHADSYRIELSLASSSICTPLTAPPGYSRHEAGLAVDFVCGSSNQALGYGRCYRWLVRNAHQFGFYNLPSEPWHWSIDGR